MIRRMLGEAAHRVADIVTGTQPEDYLTEEYAQVVACALEHGAQEIHGRQAIIVAEQPYTWVVHFGDSAGQHKCPLAAAQAYARAEARTAVAS